MLVYDYNILSLQSTLLPLIRSFTIYKSYFSLTLSVALKPIRNDQIKLSLLLITQTPTTCSSITYTRSLIIIMIDYMTSHSFKYFHSPQSLDALLKFFLLIIFICFVFDDPIDRD